MSLRILACLTVAAGAAFTGKHVLAEPPGMLAQARQERSVLAGKVQAEVEAALASARRLMRDDPAETEQNLKLMLENLERMPDLDAAISSQLRQQVKTAIREARQQRSREGDPPTEGRGERVVPGADDGAGVRREESDHADDGQQKEDQRQRLPHEAAAEHERR